MKWFIFYEKFNWWDFIYICVCASIYTYIHVSVMYLYIYIHIMHTHLCPSFPPETWGFLRSPMLINEVYLFHAPLSPPRPTSPPLRHPRPQPVSTQGWLFWSGVVGKAALWHSSQHRPDWMYCSLSTLFLLRSVSCPERRNKGLEFTEGLFLKSLYALPTFFFFF